MEKLTQYSLFDEGHYNKTTQPKTLFEDSDGDKELLDRSSVAVVGSRNASLLGLKLTKRFTKVLVDNNCVVVSGLAKGVDTAAHKTALYLNGKTISVLGTPLHRIYPAENKDLAKEIACKGLLLTTAKRHETFGKYLFPKRNKCMAQISKASLVIEAGEKSGVIHQCTECLKDGKTLIFLQHQVDKNYKWVNGFIEAGAKVVSSEEELTDILNRL